jgi:hypothetical protein
MRGLRGLTILLSRFLQVAAAMMPILLAVAMAIVVVVALLAFR